jgi:hypothetical protein
VFARGYGGVQAWQLQGGSWQRLTQGGPFDDPGGWNQPQYYATIHSADLVGDAHEELYGRASDGLHVYQLAPPGWNWLQQYTLTDLSNANGWTNPSWYSTLQDGDIDGEGKDDVLGRASDGVHAWQFQNGGSRRLPVLPAFQDFEGGNQPRYYSTIQTARLTRFPIDAVIGRGPDGLEAYLFPEDWEKLAIEGDLSDSAGWGNERYYATIRSANLGQGGADAILARGLAGIQSYGYDLRRNAWETLSAPFPPFVDEEATAYKAINAFIGGADNPGFDLRQAYPDASATQLDTWQRDDLPAVPKPPNVSDAAWDAVKAQLGKELANARLVLTWYDDKSAGGYLHTLIDDQFTVQGMDTSAQTLRFNAQSSADLAMQEWGVFVGIFNGLGGLGVIEGPAGDFAVVTSSLVSGVTSTGFGTPDAIDDAIEGIEGSYVALRNKLASDFQSALRGIGRTNIAIQSDYGLQSAVGGLIGSNAWQQLTGDPRAQALAGAARNYAISSWQTITPGIWIAFRFPPSQVGNWCDSGEDYPPGNCQWRNAPDGGAYTLAYPNSGTCFPAINGPCLPVQQGLTNTLFAPTSQQCQLDFDLSTCGLGVPLSDVFLGQNGWGRLPLRSCTSRNNPRAPAAISCPQTRP